MVQEWQDIKATDLWCRKGGGTLRLLICGAGRVAEQGGRTLTLLICGAGRVAEQGGRTLRLLICGAGRVADYTWGVVYRWFVYIQYTYITNMSCIIGVVYRVLLYGHVGMEKG